MELLAPAGNVQALHAAIDAGADGVYLAYTAFGARAGAGNFTLEELAKAVSLCHLWHIKVYVTVNTLVKEREMPQLEEVIFNLNRLKVDGVIVQDIGVGTYIKKHYPYLPIHASTQMAIHNVQGAMFLKDAGFSRVVLARENSLKTIGEVARTGIETEIFVHGALCVSQSGQCLFSGMVGGRSGNRGRCAQACRLPYQYEGQWGNWLSPRDMNLRDELNLLAEAGVTSLKIEGRVKRPEYVSEITASYRLGINSLASGSFQKAGEEESRRTAQMFNRGGFTKGYALGAQDGAIIDETRVNHQGVYIGKVTRVEKNFAFVLVEQDLNPEDGLRFLSKTESETTYSGPQVPKGDQAKVRLRPDMAVGPGTRVMRLWDAQQLKQASLRRRPTIGLTAQLRVAPGEKSQLILKDGEHEAVVYGDVVEAAQKAALTYETAFLNLSKLKETPYHLTALELIGEKAFMPPSKLNQLRTDGVQALNAKRINAFEMAREKPCPAPYTLQKGISKSLTPPKVLVKSGNLGLASQFLARGAQLFLYAPRDFRLPMLDAQLLALPKGSWLALPTQLSSASLKAISESIKKYSQIEGVALGNIGQLGQEFSVQTALLDTVPIWNKKAFETLSRYQTVFETAWPELNQRELGEVELAANRPLVYKVYGHTRLMTLNHCPARTRLGLERGREKCTLCMTGAKQALLGKTLTDRKGYTFPLIPVHQQEGCTVELLNSLPTSLFAHIAGLGQNRSILFDFTLEPPEEQLQIFEAFMDKREGKNSQNPIKKNTQGHFARGVE